MTLPCDNAAAGLQYESGSKDIPEQKATIGDLSGMLPEFKDS